MSLLTLMAAAVRMVVVIRPQQSFLRTKKISFDDLKEIATLFHLSVLSFQTDLIS